MPSKKTNSPQKDVQAEMDCSFLDEVMLMSITDQVAWLRLHQEEIRKNYLKCIEKFHIMNYGDYMASIKEYWGNINPVYTDIPISEFLKKNCSYDEFAIFDADENHKVNYRMDSRYSTMASCYSIPFFHSIAQNHPELGNDPENAYLRFTKGRVKDNNVIMFYIPSVPVGFFDYSHYPRGTAAMRWSVLSDNFSERTAVIFDCAL